MTPEEWDAHVKNWQQRGGKESSKASDPQADPPDDDSWLGTAKSFGMGMAREGVSQLPDALGGSSEFAKGGDPNSTPEWLGRKATDFAPAIALDIAQPELGIPAMGAGTLGRFATEALRATGRGALGGAAASPGNRKAGATMGALAGGGSSVGGQAIKAASPALWPAAIGLEAMRHGLNLPLIYPWMMVHGLSALGALARSAGVKAPATAGALGAQVEQGAEGE